MKEGNSAAKGVLILSIAGILTKVISLLYVPFLKSILGPEGYGIYYQITDVFLFVYALTSVGAQPAVAKVVSEFIALEEYEEAERTLKISRNFYVFIGLIVGTLMLLLAKPLTKLGNIPETAYGIMALAPCVVITAALSSYRGYMQGKMNMKAIGVSQILEQLINIFISLLFAFILVQFSLEFGAAGGQIGTSVGALFACFYIIYCRNESEDEFEEFKEAKKEKKKSNKQILKRVISYSIPIIISSGLQNFGGLVDMVNVKNRLLVAGFEKDMANILYGNYGVYKTLYGVPLILITAIGTTVLPTISRAMALKDRKEIRRNIKYAFKVALAIAIPAAVGLSMLSEEIYITLCGSTDGAKIMTIGSFIIILMTMTQIQSVILQGINKFYFIVGSFSIGIMCKIIANYIFVGIPKINIYGAIIGSTIWLIIPSILNHIKIKKTMRMKLPLVRYIVKPVLASIVMALAIILIHQPLKFIYRFIEPSRLTAIPVVIISVGVGVFIYAYFMILMRGITKEDIQKISPKIIRMMPRFMRRKLR